MAAAVAGAAGGVGVVDFIAGGVWLAMAGGIGVFICVLAGHCGEQKRDLMAATLSGPLCEFPTGIDTAWEDYSRLNPTEFSTALTSGDPNVSPELQRSLAALNLRPGLNVLENNGFVSLVYQHVRGIPAAVQSKVQGDLFENFDLSEADKVQATMHSLYGRYLEYCSKKQPGEASAEDPEIVAMVDEGMTVATEAWKAMPEPVKDHLFGEERNLTITKWNGAF